MCFLFFCIVLKCINFFSQNEVRAFAHSKPSLQTTCDSHMQIVKPPQKNFCHNLHYLEVKEDQTKSVCARVVQVIKRSKVVVSICFEEWNTKFFIAGIECDSVILSLPSPTCFSTSLRTL
jgi:hypothetical protein